jgi:hypothetical protein
VLWPLGTPISRLAFLIPAAETAIQENGAPGKTA